MNKWMKSGLAGLMVSTVSIVASAAPSVGSVDATHSMIDSVLVDASDLIAKKLKDRMIQVDDAQLAAIDQVLIDASDLIAKKLKDRMIIIDK